MAAPTIDDELVRRINEALVHSGERERLKQLVRTKLEGAGWFERVRTEADREMKTRNADTLSPQELTTIVAPRAAELVPPRVRQELEEEIRQFLDAHISIA